MYPGEDTITYKDRLPPEKVIVHGLLEPRQSMSGPANRTRTDKVEWTRNQASICLDGLGYST